AARCVRVAYTVSSGRPPARCCVYGAARATCGSARVPELPAVSHDSTRSVNFISLDTPGAAPDPDPTLRPQLEVHVSGQYEIEGELGGGGMSRVFVARDLSLNRRVAIKVLPP